MITIRASNNDKASTQTFDENQKVKDIFGNKKQRRVRVAPAPAASQGRGPSPPAAITSPPQFSPPRITHSLAPSASLGKSPPSGNHTNELYEQTQLQLDVSRVAIPGSGLLT